MTIIWTDMDRYGQIYDHYIPMTMILYSISMWQHLQHIPLRWWWWWYDHDMFEDPMWLGRSMWFLIGSHWLPWCSTKSRRLRHWGCHGGCAGGGNGHCIEDSALKGAGERLVAGKFPRRQRLPVLIHSWLVVSNSLKNMKVNWDDYSQYIYIYIDGKIKMLQNTNHIWYDEYQNFFIHNW